VQVEAFAIRLRQRSAMEAADLGVRLCQHAAPSVFKCYLAVAIPLMAFSLASFEIATWLPTIALWWAKPWLDRTILFVLARAAFGQDTTITDLWQAQRQVWWGQFLRTWTTRRLSLWRSFTQPVYQLEGLTGSQLRKRIRQIRVGKSGPPLLMTSAFATVELAVMASLLSLVLWFAPKGYAPNFWDLVNGESGTEIQLAIAIAYTVTVAVIEPFYVGAGFAMYLNRRVDLEAWDVEQEFRRADFARTAK
jgi:hypothetical protein